MRFPKYTPQFISNTIERKFIRAVFAALIILAFDFYGLICIAGGENRNARIYFLNVGQGDSELIVFPTGARVLIDGGPPNGMVLSEIGKIFSVWNRSIDAVILTHPERDHFGGLVEILRRVSVGAVLTNGFDFEEKGEGLNDLKSAIEESKATRVSIAKGDVMRNGDSVIRVLWPPKEISPKTETNDTSIVALLETGELKALFTGDIGDRTEKAIMFSGVKADILKIPHHGSRYSSGSLFLQAVDPAAVFIEVGVNSYGHPSADVLERLTKTGARVWRTDTDGTVMAELMDGKLKIYGFGD
ncbi:hypothetical protein A3I34_01585 [Candidatus Jorgensenbacteria bacterium RIFCSPLOWO2_02_FULL_45_12]|uniref:Metallo-beta-lactamase domain-containing protein n=1 Tax=Candidatus Jorgensenbacteria bacterium RIFCSPHIGHO2_02_FULL_45_20 TaxID=1798470 RepID=A0A1F6BR49_9BACT|nr:MAG: hypothetical protein A3D55_00580 [Candidatus Jorgensenbacteria bacterium RIFCSPHIGHO2_02_FULL_45_20]OGG42695.1 MAG: hypothetical protein A3I34_01585 [Candidatus Jorgensenbacteria bacterium RIFCSPLOWO2_02_FULL_45_12]